LLRRILVLAVLLFWQGGFTFYSAVVIHVGRDVLGSHREQGFVTRRVTNYLNLAGLIALPILAWDVATSRDPVARRRWVRWASWSGMALTLALLAWMHPHLDAFLDPVDFSIREHGTFCVWHSWYLHASTVQWGCALLYTLLALWAWRAEDRAEGATG
jgi:hypothetical protein